MTHFVFDGSNHDWTRGPMDVAAMARDGIEGGWHKFADGLGYYVDPYFPEAARRMRGSSFKFWGAYHVLWGNRDINAQADWQIALLDQQVPGWRTDPRFRMVSDDEPFGYNRAPSIAQINQYHDRWAARVPGVMQVAYAPRWYYGSSVSGIRYPVIGSNYGSNPAVHYPTGYPGDGSPRWADGLLQYGSMLIQGTQTQTDCNAVKDEALWAQLTGGETMGAHVFELSDAPGAQYLGTPGGGFYAARSPADFESQNLAPLIPVGPFTRAQAEHIFGPCREWVPLPGPAGPPGKDGAPGPAGPAGPKGDAAVLTPGTTLIVGPQS